MTQQETSAEKKVRPIVKFLRIPDNYPEEQPYLWGSKCTNCGTVFLGSRVACAKCCSTGPFEEVRLSDEGEIYVFTVMHQSFPGIPTPYIAGIIDLPEGVCVRANIEGLDPNNPSPEWFGKKVKIVAEKVATDREGNDVIAAKFRVVDSP